MLFSVWLIPRSVCIDMLPFVKAVALAARNSVSLNQRKVTHLSLGTILRRENGGCVAKI